MYIERSTWRGPRGPFLGPAYGRYPNKLILPEFVSYLGERGVLCVGNGSHLCTPVLLSMCNVTFQVLRLSVFFDGYNWRHLSKHKTFVQRLYNVGPILRRWANIVQMVCVCWDVTAIIGDTAAWKNEIIRYQILSTQDNIFVRVPETNLCLGDGPESIHVNLHFMSATEENFP